MDPNLPLDPSQYSSRVAIEEIAALDRQLRAVPMPHIAAFLDSRLVSFLLHHLQNFIWTAERLKRRTIGGRQTGSSRGIKPAHPRLPADCELARVPRCPRVWIDVTNTHRSNIGGGIARAARELAAAALRSGSALPVVIEDGQLFPYYAPAETECPLVPDGSITYVILDTFWKPADEYVHTIKSLKLSGVKTVVCIYDVIPLYYPAFFDRDLICEFDRAFREIIPLCDGCVAISRYSLSKIQYYIRKFRLEKSKTVEIGTFQLGTSDLTSQAGIPRECVRTAFSQMHTFLSVGTLEPRKGYAVSLDAFDILWRNGVDVRFVIIGREGWVTRSLVQRIADHHELGKRLFWFADANDAELQFAYQQAYCVVQASITEGMGLPLIEASVRRVPVIATDNEVFHEVGADQLLYFRCGCGEDLAAVIEKSLVERPSIPNIPHVSWDESLAQLLDFVSHVPT